MAARFVVLVALFALCHSNPVLENGDENREGRSWTYGQSSATGAGGGTNVASVKSINNNAEAFGSNDGGNPAAPGQANAVVYKSDAEQVVNIPRAQPFGYYPAVPAPARYLYQAAPVAGAGFAKSDAQTTPFGSSAQSVATNNHPAGYVVPAVEAVKVLPAQKSISWRFGTAYGTPQYVVKSPEYVAPTYTPIVYEASAAPNAQLLASSNTQGEGESDANAQQNSLGSQATAHSQSQNSGVATSGSSVGAPAPAPAYYRNVAGWNDGRLLANTGSTGNANSDAKAINNFNGHTVNSAARSHLGGAARSGSSYNY